jgi:6-phosphogluconolactonase (cycloisomerase 2 family)
MFLYLSTSNKLSVVQVEEETGNLIKIVQTIEPIVDPLPDNVNPTGMFKPITEWVETHPKFPLLYVFTSFWNLHPAYVTTYRIHKLNGSLEKLGVCETGGHQAAHVTFSPDGSILCVAHYMDGNLSFLDCSQDKCLEPPIKVVETPEVIPGTRSMDFPRNLPSSHHVQYGPNGAYLLTSDPSAQGCVWTYPVDERGLVTSETPFRRKCPPIRAFPSLVSRMFTNFLCQAPYRIRRTVVHPNGRYAYVLFETHAVLQVYEISTDGKLSGDCLQELPTTDEEFANSKMPIGIAATGPAELVATEDGVWVSNRGVAVWGRAESSVRHFGYEEDGARLVPRQALPVAGPVRHFFLHKNKKIYAGVSSETPGLVETFAKQEDGTYQKVGQAAVGLGVLCIAIKE